MLLAAVVPPGLLFELLNVVPPLFNRLWFWVITVSEANVTGAKIVLFKVLSVGVAAFSV